LDTTTDITRLPEWAIYAYGDVWPRVPGYAFIVDAAARAIWTKFGVPAIEVGTDPYTHGYRSEVAQRLAEFLTDGNLIAYARPTGGTRLAPIATAEWDLDKARSAVATGFFGRRRGSQPPRPHHVFLGERETGLLSQVYSLTNMLHGPDEVGPVEKLGAIVLGSLGAIARDPIAVPIHDTTEGVMRLLLPGSVRTLHPDDLATFESAALPWLARKFEEDTARELMREDIEEQALVELAPLMTKRLFDRVWSRARSLRNHDSFKAHSSRFDPGRRRRI
jgi:hypothetical protein